MSSTEEAKAEARASMLRQFESWLDSALAEEPPPEGLAAGLLAALREGERLPATEGRIDMYSLWSAMAGLTQEVKLQSRTFRQLNETLITSQQAAAIPADADVLLDLRDRLQRGLDAARDAAGQQAAAPRRLRLSRWLGWDGKDYSRTRDALQALDHGYALTLQRLDQALGDLGFHPMRCMGQMFDPHRMTAVELDETGDAPEGTVVGIYSDGYECKGQLYRAAQVKVARNKREKEDAR